MADMRLQANDLGQQVNHLLRADCGWDDIFLGAEPTDVGWARLDREGWMVFGSHNAVALTMSPSVPDEVRDEIGEALDAYNIAQAGPYNREALWIVARDTDGMLVGGLKGQVDYAWLMIDWLWCHADRRRRGLGRRLMQTAETFARSKGCRGIWVQTATYQAPGFYERLGYAEFGRLEELLPGHDMIWLRKLLQRGDRAIA
jgi:GNAT superfamily N-acetyltransferase